ncbi:MAG: hypothetical protein GX483_08960 [Actinomycetaceae bacterium]|nr:hypothetical protein [Actinomycetaceae bacterium]
MEKTVSVKVDDLKTVLNFFEDIKYADVIMRVCQSQGFREQVKLMMNAKLVEDSFAAIKKLIQEAEEPKKQVSGVVEDTYPTALEDAYQTAVKNALSNYYEEMDGKEEEPEKTATKKGTAKK